jgi:hypothetical protein
MKNKNPLYVVKGTEVQEASSIFDLVVKKFNLEPVMLFLKNLFSLMLEQVQNFAMFKAVKDFMDKVIQQVLEIGKRVSSFAV